MKEQRKKSFDFIWVFLLAGVLVIVFSWLAYGNTGVAKAEVSLGQVAEILHDEEVVSVGIKQKEKNTVIDGIYRVLAFDSSGAPILDKDGKQRKKNVGFTCETVNSHFDTESFEFEVDDPNTPDVIETESYTIMEILDWRQDDKGNSYYYGDSPIVTIVDAYKTNWFVEWLPTILIVGGGIILVFIFFSRMSASVNSSNNKAMEFNRSRARREDTSKIRFTGVAGADEEKAELVEMVDYLKNPKKYSEFGAKLPKGVLLVGPPGTGKTLLAKAVAGEAGVPFYSISGSDFVEMFVGVGAGRVRDMFKKAKQTAPCLIFIDEIDAVGRQRGAGLGGGNDEREQTLNQLLVEMDGFSDNSGIIVMAATNRDDVLDPALLRAGRFDRQITVDLPDNKGREAILKVHARNKKIDPSVDFSQIARRTTGFSGADLENVLNEAAILSVREKKNIITIKEIDEAIDRRIGGPAKASRSMTEKERKQVAYHEAGHAVIGLRLPYSDKVQKITIVPRGRTGGHVLMGPEEDRFLATKKELLARIVGYLGGRSSEELFFDDISTGAHNDIEVATHIARLMVTEYGMSSLGPIQYERDSGSVFLGRDYTSSQKNFSTQIAYEIDTEVRKIIEEAHQKALEVLKEYRDDVTLIAETLLAHETINAEQIDYLLEHRELPPVKDEEKEEVAGKEATEEPSVTEVDEKEEPKVGDEGEE